MVTIDSHHIPHGITFLTGTKQCCHEYEIRILFIAAVVSGFVLLEVSSMSRQKANSPAISGHPGRTIFILSFFF